MLPCPRLSVVVPAFNEGPRLERSLLALRAYLDAAFPGAELIVVDDGSEDGTQETLAAAVSAARAIVVRRRVNGGKGAAVRDGILRSTGDVVLYLDADLPYPLEAIASAVQRI